MSGDGFQDDCLNLIQSYCEHKSTDYQLFCEEWKRKGFHYVFFGYSFQHELVVNTENYFTILKNIFSNLSTTAERVAALYLMYSMYFKQPSKDFCKFRYTLIDWQKMKKFYDAISTEPMYLQARTIFWRLWQANAFRFVACEQEQYPEAMQHSKTHLPTPNFNKFNSTVIGTIKCIQDESRGMLCAIETLQVGYNEMKEHFKVGVTECSDLRSTNVLRDIGTKLGKVCKLFDGNNQTKSQTLTEEYTIPTDGSETNDTENLDEIDDIGSRRALLRHRAMSKVSNELHRFKSSVEGSSPNKSSWQQSPAKEESREKFDFEQKDVKPNKCVKVERSSNVYVNNSNGNVVINHPKKVYHRFSGIGASSVGRQIVDCPSEVSAEIDSKPPRKKSKLK